MQGGAQRDDGREPAGAGGGLLAALAAVGDERGAFDNLGERHHALLVDASTDVLLVTFESLANISAREARLPAGLTIADRHGWSQLTLIAEGETGWRDPRVYAYFDRLVDDGFFEDFERVVFYGAGVAGHAACAYAVAAPGASVLALSPRATLDPARAGWDRRNPSLRRADFTSRYGYAPDMIGGAAQAFVIHDPWVIEDAMHASLFCADHVTQLHWRGLGSDSEARLAAMGLLLPLIRATCEGRLNPAGASLLWRSRRSHLPWLRALLAHVEAAERDDLAIRLCRYVLQRHSAPRFQKRLEELLEGRPGAGRGL